MLNLYVRCESAGTKGKTKKMIEQNKTKKEMGNFSIDRPGIYLDGRADANGQMGLKQA